MRQLEIVAYKLGELFATNSIIDASLLIKPNHTNIPQTLSLHQFQHQIYGISILVKMKYFKIDT